ncbi:MAG TPA: response regulator [Nitrososphaera sp.]|nr:response regulator [Nitrososphaera sp.]
MLSLLSVKDIYDGFFLSNNNNFVSPYTKDHSSHNMVLHKKLWTNHVGDESDNNTIKQKTRLLIVDDEPDVVQLFKLALQQNSRFLVDAFTNPKEALQSFTSNANSYSLMITDVRMPELSGIQLTEKVKEINPNIKVVLTTAYDMRKNELSRLFSAARIDGFIQKPIGIEELSNKILSIMGSV